MSEPEKKKTLFNSKLFQKVKGIKHLEIVVAVVLGAIALLVYFSFFSPISTSKSTISTSTSTKTNMSEYTANLENKLSSVLSSVKGAGNVSVMISFDGNPSYIYATNDDTKTNTVSNGTTETSTSQTSTSPILIDVGGEEQALICQEVLPKIKGVLIISSGAEDVSVRLELLKATQAILDVPTSNIEILVGNKK